MEQCSIGPEVDLRAVLNTAEQVLTELVRAHKLGKSAIRMCAEDHVKLQRHLSKNVSRLRHLKKPRDREVLESKIRQMVADIIRREAVLYEGRKTLQEAEALHQQKTGQYAILSVHYFCRQIRATLPREIRDLVHKELVGNQTVETTSMSADLPGRVDLGGFLLKTGTALTLNYWLDLEVLPMLRLFHPLAMGDASFQEFIEIWFRETTFIFRDGSLIPQFINCSPWKFPTKPGDVVRKILFRVPEKLLRRASYISRLQKINRQRFLIVTLDVGPKFEILNPLFDGVGLFHSLTKLQLHIVPDLDRVRNGSICIDPVQPWDKSQDSLELLLGGLSYLHGELSRLQVLDTSILLDTGAKCRITKDNAVWSPLGWLGKAFEWGLEQKGF